MLFIFLKFLSKSDVYELCCDDVRKNGKGKGRIMNDIMERGRNGLA